MKCQFDAFADYVSEAEANGIENFDLYEWTKKTIDNPAKKSKYTKCSRFIFRVETEVYEKDKADALEAELEHLVGEVPSLAKYKYDSDPAHNPQPPRETSPFVSVGDGRRRRDITSCLPARKRSPARGLASSLGRSKAS